MWKKESMQQNKISPVVSAIFDHIVVLKGAYNYAQNQFFEINKTVLMVISATQNQAFCLASTTKKITVGDKAKPQQETVLITTYKQYFGSVINIYGDILFCESQIDKFTNPYEHTNVFFPSPRPLFSHLPLKEQLITGYISIDLLVPIGKGQSQLILGDRETGKTFLALNTIINQKNRAIKCIYVAIGQTQNKLAKVYQMLKKHDALAYTIIISAPAYSPYEQYLVPYVAMAHAENLHYEHDVLIVFDDLTSHANVYREMALLIDKPVGKEAFPGDMFYAHARLLERSGRFKGAKTITALPIFQTIDNDITSLVASNLISITYGQLVMNPALFAAHRFPAVSLDLSVSRIGSRIQKPYMAKIAKTIGKSYRSYLQQIKLAALKQDLNPALNRLIVNGEIIEKMFIQKNITSYIEHEIFLTAKLLAWNVLAKLPNVYLALQFLMSLIATNQTAQMIFNTLLNENDADEELVKNYFLFCLQTFANHQKLNWKIKPKQQFIPISDDELAQIVAKMQF